MPNKTENGVNAIVITYYGNFAEDNVPREVCRILMGRGYYPDSISTNHTHPSEIGFNEAYYYFGSPG
ncbi:hypothetical protein HYT23_03520 [Candidatus Pacearchaeota archaeon]|nr:hypothetical protein [Candidatus Pacearchaeota archaeon]